MRFNLKHGMWTNGTNSPFELIKCPTLVLEAEKDDSFPRQPKKYMMPNMS